jgi:ribosomal protein S18 acetylase RimI-like enzyme
MQFRRATIDDAAKIAHLLISAWRTAYRGIVPDSYLQSLSPEERTARLRQSFLEEKRDTYLAETGDELLGFVTIGPSRDPDVDATCVGEIRGIYLAPEYWRRGIGTYLLMHGQRILKRRGYAQATLWVLAANIRARRFYEAMGFRVDGATKELSFGVVLQAVRYRKDLGPLQEDRYPADRQDPGSAKCTNSDLAPVP